MVDFFNAVIAFFQEIWTFISNLLEAIVTFLGMLMSAQFMTPYILSAVPGIVGSCFVGVLAIAVLKLLAGR